MNHHGGDFRFHEKKHRDLYDLYNACNGVLHNGTLDVRKLDELDDGERRALNIPRLRELWEHLAAGCAECAAIINTLNFARRVLRERIAESSIMPSQPMEQGASVQSRPDVIPNRD